MQKMLQSIIILEFSCKNACIQFVKKYNQSYKRNCQILESFIFLIVITYDIFKMQNL